MTQNKFLLKIYPLEILLVPRLRCLHIRIPFYRRISSECTYPLHYPLGAFLWTGVRNDHFHSSGTFPLMIQLWKSLVKWSNKWLDPCYTNSAGTLPDPDAFLFSRSWQISFTSLTLILIDLVWLLIFQKPFTFPVALLNKWRWYFWLLSSMPSSISSSYQGFLGCFFYALLNIFILYIIVNLTRRSHVNRAVTPHSLLFPCHFLDKTPGFGRM